MPDTQPQQAMALAICIMQEVFFWDDERCLTPEGRAGIGAVAEKLDAYAAERIAEVTDVGNAALVKLEATTYNDWTLNVEAGHLSRTGVTKMTAADVQLLRERDAALARAEAAEAHVLALLDEPPRAALIRDRDAALAKLEAAEAERDQIAAESLAAIVGRQRAEERVRVLESAQAKVREWAIVDEIHGGKRGDDPEWRGQSCLLCRRRGKLVIWEVGEPERHAPECPAALAKAAAAEGGKRVK